MEITAIPPTMPPARPPTFELRPPTGEGVGVFDVAPFNVAIVAGFDVAVFDVASFGVAVCGVAVFDLAVFDVTSLDVAVFDVAVFNVELSWTEGPNVPIIVPEQTSGESIIVRRRCETVTGGRGGRESPTTNVIRFAGVPIIPILGRIVSTLSKKKARQRTVTSKRAQRGIHVPGGTGLGLWVGVNLEPNRFFATTATHETRDEFVVQLNEYRNQLEADT